VRVGFGDDVIEDSAFGRLPTRRLRSCGARVLDKKRDLVAARVALCSAAICAFQPAAVHVKRT
jgi:hypothetical protein